MWARGGAPACKPPSLHDGLATATIATPRTSLGKDRRGRDMPWAAAGLLALWALCLYARAALPEVYASAPALRAGIRRAAGRARATRGGGVVVYASAPALRAGIRRAPPLQQWQQGRPRQRQCPRLRRERGQSLSLEAMGSERSKRCRSARHREWFRYTE